MNTPKPDYKYSFGGTLRVEDRTYVTRQADRDFYEGLKAGEFCYVLNSRQMGKSSLRVRTMARLKSEGIACAAIDITAIIDNGTTEEKWYAGIIRELVDSFELSNGFNLGTWWRERSSFSCVQRFSEFIETVLLAQSDRNFVIFLDEIDSILKLKSAADNFFAYIRSCWNKRADRPEYRRLTFAILGVAEPSDLIQDRQRTPFNIGRAIELNGFSFDEAQPLIDGLRSKAENPQVVLQEILKWTGGQPFLTQKLCKLVAESTLNNSLNAESLIEEIVKKEIINNWEDRDDPEHLKTIQDRLIPDKEKILSNWKVGDSPGDLQIIQKSLLNEESTRKILLLYNNIRQKGEIKSDGSFEQQRLKLSGLVINQDGKLKIYNRIYAKVFNRDWLEQQLDALSPYPAESIMAWQDSNFTDKSRLLRGKALKDAQAWRKGKNLSDLDNRFLSASERAVDSRTFFNIILVILGAIATIAAIVTYRNNQSLNDANTKLNDANTKLNDANTKLNVESQCFRENGVPGKKVGKTCYRNVISTGDQIVFPQPDQLSNSLTEGMQYFRELKYQKAQEFFKKSIDEKPEDPVSQIFWNNTQALLNGNPPIKIAVVAAIDDNPAAAIQILRGVADAQYKFNQNNGKNGRLLEIAIVNDSNKSEAAADVAETLMRDEKIVAVIGHHTSAATQAALKKYENIAIISGTANADTLKESVFFSSVGSTKNAAFATTNYLKKHPKIDKIVGFFNPDEAYSKALKKDFDNEENEKILKALKKDLKFESINNLDIENKVKKLKQDKIQAVLLLSDVRTNSSSLKIAQANFQIEPTRKLKLIGLMALPEELILPKKDFNEMIIINPCLDENSAYTKDAKRRWKRPIYWRTATSYDATQALIAAIEKSKSPTREEILRNLPTIELSKKQTSGFGLKWSETDGRFNSQRPYCTFQVDNSAQKIKPIP
jgi:ABC-type branched-subunit amino acid transport system substrate-binding protein